MIAGGPRAGKTTLAETIAEIDGRVHHTSAEVEQFDWGNDSIVAAGWLNEPGAWVCDGVVMVRALRKWLANNPNGRPADMVVFLKDPVIERTPGQSVMAKACKTIWDEISHQLVLRGSQVVEF